MYKILIIVFSQFVLFWPLFSFSLVSAETIILKSGQRVEGKILEQTDSSIKVETDGVQLTFFLDQIGRIERTQDVSPSGDKTNITAKQPLGEYNERDSEYNAIRNVIENFFQHQFDEDKKTALQSISKDYVVEKLDGTKIDYNQLEKGLDKRNFNLGSFDDLLIEKLNVKGGKALARIHIAQTLKRASDGRIIKNKIVRRVSLKKEQGEWKITGINDPRNPGNPQVQDLLDSSE